ncbi:DUF2561 family protein [Mycobacterium sp. SM1]|uniref:DUF2561 family protein n=1 Tax=Mycobacterium sp. SM1 TaxID=2816243 RepID=UPI001BCFB6BE|nr:DUF2561 family protein [Mycobacterium sp. SM1]MBS4730246.1 DUF2561 family protein [Mycobacterium sp. SM1]
MVDRDPRAGRGWGTVSLSTTDRILLGLCAGVWLLLVGVSVAAIVALVDLGRGFRTGAGNAHTPAALYAIIAVSVVVILAAIPLLLRARRTAPVEPGARPVAASVPGASIRPLRPSLGSAAHGAAEQAPTERLTAFGRIALSDAEVDRIWLRGTIALLAPMGTALVSVAAATYLMAIGRYGASWTGYVIAGIATVSMIVLSWRKVRQLRRLGAEHQPPY